MTDYDELKSQLNFKWIKCIELKSQLTTLVNKAKLKRGMSQREVSDIIGVSQTKIKEIENGTCKDINAILGYLDFLSCPLFEPCDFNYA
jgi:predicted XRE-type DNA-binding protein